MAGFVIMMNTSFRSMSIQGEARVSFVKAAGTEDARHLDASYGGRMKSLSKARLSNS